MKKIFISCLILLICTLSAQTQTNNALKFDGMNDHLYAESITCFSAYTVQMWVKPDPTQPSPNNILFEQYLFPGTAGDYDAAFICRRTCGASCYEFWLYDQYGDDPISITFELTPNVWQQLTIIQPGEQGTCQVFVNGNIVASAPTFGGAYGIGWCGQSNTYFGSNQLGEQNWKGSMDEIRLWNRELTESEIQANINCPLTGNETGLLFYYKLDQGTAGGNNTSITSAIDATVNGHYGSLIGFDLTGSNSNFVTGATLNCSNSCIVSAGADENIYYGYLPDQSVTKTAQITNPVGTLTYNWTLSRALLPGETMTGANSASVTVSLIDTAELCLTVSGSGCNGSDCAMIFAEDVRCTSGSGNNSSKVKLCHNGNSICVEQNAVNAHLNHGDYLGACIGSVANLGEFNIEENSKTGFCIYPNPASNQITLQNNDHKLLGTVSIYDITGKMIYKKFIGSSQTTIDVKSFSSGVYYIRSDQLQAAIKFVKQ